MNTIFYYLFIIVSDSGIKIIVNKNRVTRPVKYIVHTYHDALDNFLSFVTITFYLTNKIQISQNSHGSCRYVNHKSYIFFIFKEKFELMKIVEGKMCGHNYNPIPILLTAWKQVIERS